MSIFGRRVSPRAVAALAMVLIVAALLPVMSKTPSREITLVARGMAFYADGDVETPNPTIHVKPGETVRIILQNEDRGMLHDFAVPTVSEAMSAIRWNQRGTLTFEAPLQPGRYEYICRPHALMMHGVIVVDPS